MGLISYLTTHHLILRLLPTGGFFWCDERLRLV